MNDTPNLALPYILAAQAQKHVTHNEAIRALDCLVQLSVESRALAAPPATPADGSRYIVAAAASGAWTGKSGSVAAFQDGAWAFFAPRTGWLAWVADEHSVFVYAAGAWSAYAGGGSGSITDLDNLAHVGVNTTADTTNRLSLKAPASLFDNEGAGHQQKINKHAAGDTASVLYQTNYSGRAEMGLAGDDDFHFKVSPDGSTWYEALKIDRTTGRADFPRTGIVAPRNRIINPLGQFAQAGLASTADAAYTGFDQWYALTQSGAITPSQLTSVESGTPFMMRLTQAQASAQRFGLAQPFESANVLDLRGKMVSFRARLRCSASTTIRWALVEWTGTADSLTKDVVNDWTNATFTAGNFFISTTTTIVGTGSVAVTANTLTDAISNALGTVSGSMNNLVLLIWTDSAQAQNVTLDIGNVWLGAGSGTPSTFEPPDPANELRACRRYFFKITSPTLYTYFGIAQGLTSTIANVGVQFPVQMRVPPTFSQSTTCLQVGAAQNAVTSLGAGFIGVDGGTINLNSSGLTTNACYTWEGNNSSSAYIAGDARL